MVSGNNPSFVLHIEPTKSLKIEERPVPQIVNPDDVLIRVTHTGICGSDVHYWQHGSIGPFVVKAPMVLGHESAGTVVSVGPAVKSLQPGQRVALEPGVSCRKCGPCKSAKYNLCRDMEFAATPPYDGSLCKYYILPADLCIPLPEHVSSEEGALLEPTSVAVHVAKLANIGPADSVLVFGAGPVGVLTAAVARAFGSHTVVVVDVNNKRLEFAKEFAATHTLNSLSLKSPQEVADAISALAPELSDGADKVVDATGAPPCIAAAVYAVKPGGTIVQAGMGAPEIKYPIVEMAAKEVVVKGSFRYSAGDYELAGKLVAGGKVEVKRLVTHRFEFDDAEKAFETVKKGEGIKVVIEGPKGEDTWKV